MSPEQRGAMRLIVRGRVQGVGYRDWTLWEAWELGLDGWVRNLDDGSVEILAAGPVSALAELERRCHQGPRHALVTMVERLPAEDPGTLRFHVRLD